MRSNLRDIGPILERIEPLARLCEMLPVDQFSLVGGVLRDALLGRPINDIDLVSTGDPTEVAKEFARLTSSPWFWLDKERKQSRVLVAGEEPLTFDFSPLRAADLEGDLEARDFTINSMALPLPGPFQVDRIVDPLGGLEDLSLSTLRVCSSQSFASDPLRILKGIRHAVKLGFVLEEETSLSMVRHAWQLDKIAVERVRQEVWAIMGHSAAVHGFELLSSTGAGAQLWGDSYNKALADIIATVERCRSAWQRLSQPAPVTNDWLAEEAEQGLTREVLMVGTQVFACIEVDLPSEIAELWRLSRRSRSRIKAAELVNESLLSELDKVADNSRAFAFWLQKKGLDAADLILTAATKIDPSTSFEQERLLSRIALVDDRFEDKLVDLIDGDCLTREFGFAPGPDVGEALEALRDAEISGLVADEQQARAFLLEYCQNKD